MSKELILKKLNTLYKKMKELSDSGELRKYYYGDLCFYLGLDYIRKSIKEVEIEDHE